MPRYYYHRIDHPNGPEHENYLAHEQWNMYRDLIHDQDTVDLTTTSRIIGRTGMADPPQCRTNQI